MPFLLGIDPGHGGTNIGGPLTQAVGIREKDETRRLSEELAHSLPRDRIDVEILRFGDETVSLADRGLRSAACDGVFSIHINAHESSSIGGAEVYVLPGSNRLLERLTARAILGAMPSELSPTRLVVADPQQAGWLERPYNVLSVHTCPAILIEVCYATNPLELRVLQSDWGRMAIVSALRSGVATMLKSCQED